MSDTIQVDYQALRKLAQKFEEQHQKMHRLAHELTHTVQNLKRGGWISDAANDFYRDMDNNLLPRLNRLERALHSSATKTEEIGRIMRGGEEEATGSVKSTGGGGGLAGIANSIRDMINNGAFGGGESGDPIGGSEGAAPGDGSVSNASEGAAPGDGSVSNASEGGIGSVVGEAAGGVFESSSGGGIGESIGNAANQVLQNGGGGMGAAGAAASGVVDEVLKNAGSGGLAGGASGGGGGGGSASSGGGAGSGVNTTGQGQVIRSVDMSNPTEAPDSEVSGIGNASAFGGAPADGE